MSKLEFKYPMMAFAKCKCTTQVPIKEVDMKNLSYEKAVIKYTISCSVCGDMIKEALIFSSATECDFTDLMNFFKVIPALKDELAIIKLDTVKGKIKDGEISLYGNYSHLRFWDKVIQRDIIKIPYTLKE
ncbi:hypothetical protein Amet_2015 [Alkaliphilus metalliredigens QYMF]|uniref:Uncharacterized protein n=1 Tax=Alkaliphilus metalliredigens (strain QYMF) TaxID=293826 RepID=A6TPQ9_ALKMQ|nr:hypothetical protein [Alkaliphilus metalliredigens]ABR48177.1 hypothetical protein Amet_2015 [Alkaliphilus metalliredigens QYMF]